MRRTHTEVTSSMEAKTAAAAPFEPWGLLPFDQRADGLLARTFNMLEVPDPEVGVAAAGHFLARDLSQGRRVVLVAQDSPLALLACFARFGFDFGPALERHQLICLDYKPAFAQSLALASDYRALAREINDIAGYVRRVAFLRVDTLFNLQSQYLARISAAKLAAAAAFVGATMLGTVPTPGSGSGIHLRCAAQALLPCLLSLERDELTRRYGLVGIKGAAVGIRLRMVLKEGCGLIALQE